MRLLVAASLVASSTACLVPPEEPPPPETPQGIAALGAGTHALSGVKLTTVLDRDDGLNGPRDLAFNPAVPGELWVVSRTDDSVVIANDVGTPEQTQERVKDPFALHFMEEVSSISFSPDMKFATCQESRNTYDGMQAPNDFMGPALWSADRDVFAETNPAAVAELDYDLGSHLDMLHESPLCMGIAWVDENVYFTFDGLSGTISRYDFVEDHGPGFDDHRDGIIERFPDAEVVRVEDVPSHMVVDHDTGLLYVADTGNARIAVLDPATATAEPRALSVIEPGTTFVAIDDVELTTLVDGDSGELVQPSGLALKDGVLYVSDHATSRISAFSLAGERLDFIETELPENSLMGLRVADDGSVYYLDYQGERLRRLQAR